MCTFAQAAVQNPAAPGGCSRSFAEKSSAPTWLIDLDYTPTRNLLGYAKYSRGYRAGGIAPNVSPPFDQFKPERVDAYEIGAKTSWHGSVPGSFNIAGFYNKFSNQQLQIGFNANPCFSRDVNGNCVSSAASPTAAPFNAGKSRIEGVEVDANLMPFAGLALHVGYTYLNTKITALKIPALQAGSPYILASAYVVGDALELTPKNKVTISANYTLPVDRSVGKISVGATFTHTDKVSTNPSDRFYTGGAKSTPATIAYIRTLSDVQATNLLNLNLAWDKFAGGPFDLAIFATNVTGQHYYTYSPGVASAIGFESASVGAPRMYGASVKVRFGS
jgi:iron complex outermembrane receptor protein